MRVLLITPSYHTHARAHGAEILTRFLSTKLNSVGIHTDIMTLNRNTTNGRANPAFREETEENGSCKVFREPALNVPPISPNPMVELLTIHFIPRPFFLSRLRDYDILHFIGEQDLSLLCFSYSLRKPKLLQCVGIFENGGIYKYYMYDRAFLGKTFREVLPRLADRFVISSQQEKILLGEMGVPYEKILELPICVDTDIFKPGDTKRSDNLVLFVGRIHKIKGLHILLRALSHVRVPVNLVIIGPGWDPPEYVKEIEEMSGAINKRGFHKVTFKGSLDQSDLVPWYQRASFVVCPFLYEDYSNVVRESLACGTPVLSTGTHILENGNDGVFVTSRNPEKVAKAVETLLEDREMRERYGRKGRELVERYFSWESYLQKLTRVYRDILRAYAA